MNIVHVYFAILSGLFYLLILGRQSTIFLGRLSHWTFGRLLHHTNYPRLLSGSHFINPTRAEIIGLGVYIGITAFGNSYRIRTLVEATNRAGSLAIANIVPLLATRQLSFVADALGFSVATTHRIHIVLGLMATVQGAFHSLGLLQSLKLPSFPGIIRLTCLAALGALGIPSLGRRYAYELFLHSHLALSVVLAIALWEHLRLRRRLAKIMLLISYSCFAASTIYQYCRQTFKNVVIFKDSFQVTKVSDVRTFGDSLVLELELARPWKIHPGQHIFMTLFTANGLSFLQRHPFTITWWKDSTHDGKATSLNIFIAPRKGWTSRIMRHSNHLGNLTAWLDGPYGSDYHLEEYGVVLLFASGTGIFAQLPYIKRLTALTKRYAARTRKIKLVWLTLDMHKQLAEWIQSFLDDEDLDLDLLSITIHTSEKVLPDKHISVKDGRVESRIKTLGRRLHVVYDLPDVESYVQLHTSTTCQKVAITVSAYLELRDAVRAAVVQTQRRWVRFFELDYQPFQEGGFSGGSVA